MTWREFWLVEKNIVIPGRRSGQDAEQALNAAASGPAPIFRGSVSRGEGVLRLRGLMTSSARSIHFKLLEGSGGCIIQGVLQPIFWLKFYRGFFVVMFCVYAVMNIVDTARGHGEMFSSIAMSIAILMGGITFINGYMWLVVGFTRRFERTLVKSIEFVVRDDDSAAIAAELLSLPR